MEEIWEYCHLNKKYSISNLGNIKNNTNGKLIKSSINGSGYYLVHLTLDNIRKSYRVHRLLMFAFKYNDHFENAQVNHIDGNKLNNSLDNLEWCTGKQNIQHAINNNLTPIGEDKTESKLTDEQVIEIRKLYNDTNITQREISKKFNVGQKCIFSIVNNKTWKHLHWEPKLIKEKVSRKGNLNYCNIKLMESDIPKIRKLYEEIKNYTKVGKKFGVSDTTIKKIIQGKNWTHI